MSFWKVPFSDDGGGTPHHAFSAEHRGEKEEAGISFVTIATTVKTKWEEKCGVVIESHEEVVDPYRLDDMYKNKSQFQLDQIHQVSVQT